VKEESFDLKSELKNLGMTQKYFSEYIDVHITTVNRWVRGELETPKVVKILLQNYKKAKLFDDIIDIKNLHGLI
jgi:transcriptional regulator with XRE-family HTH domain